MKIYAYKAAVMRYNFFIPVNPRALQEEDTADQYKVRYLSNAEYSWQRRSLHALQCLAVDLVTIETDE